jgi:hypothetical protein
MWLQDTSTIDKLLTYLIAPLDKNSIATNFLAEKGTTILGMNTFNGILNDTTQKLLQYIIQPLDKKQIL